MSLPEHGVDLTHSTMARLNRLERELARGMAGITSVSVGLPTLERDDSLTPDHSSRTPVPSQ